MDAVYGYIFCRVPSGGRKTVPNGNYRFEYLIFATFEIYLWIGNWSLGIKRQSH
jgi:hypothetical protein